MMRATPRRVIVYRDGRGREPFTVWLRSLAGGAQDSLLARINRLEHGNFGDSKAVGDGVHELRAFKGPEIRVYFAFEGTTAVVLLGGGNKTTQRRDIERAKRCWREYQEAK